jgi:hypothetical protein
MLWGCCQFVFIFRNSGRGRHNGRPLFDARVQNHWWDSRVRFLEHFQKHVAARLGGATSLSRPNRLARLESRTPK